MQRTSSWRLHPAASAGTAWRAFVLTALACILAPHANASIARGTVFHDLNSNGKRDRRESGIEGVRLSNGRDIAQSDAEGRYAIRLDEGDVLFVLKPRDWMTPLDEHLLPKFYYIHKPRGSRKTLKYQGMAPTGPLPRAIDFPLQRRPEPDSFRVIAWADPQVGNSQALNALQRHVIPELVGFDAAFGVTLGDIVWNNLALFDAVNDVVRHVGIPWYNVIGNHDLNFDHENPDTYIRHYGPRWYAFDYGAVHFVVLDNTQSLAAQKGRKFAYRWGDDQLEFLRNDLVDVAKDRLIVLMMHASFEDTMKADEPATRKLFSLFEGRKHVLALAGHHHRNLHYWYAEDRHWPNETPLYQLALGAVSGAWWRGIQPEASAPFIMMRDGTPAGYFIFAFDGNKWSYRFKAIGQPPDTQMRIHLPDEIPSADLTRTPVIVNVFAGNSRSRTQMRIDGGTWISMGATRAIDPYYEYIRSLEIERYNGRGMNAERLAHPRPAKSTHVWKSHLPGDLAPGSHLLEVRTTDMFGQVWHGARVFRVAPSD